MAIIMRTCSRCGCYLPDGVAVCLACGTHQSKTYPPSTQTDNDVLKTCNLGDRLIELDPPFANLSDNRHVKAVEINTICSDRRCGTCVYCEMVTYFTSLGEKIVYRCYKNSPVVYDHPKQNYGCSSYKNR